MRGVDFMFRPGRHRLRLWHEMLGEHEVEVTVGEGPTVDLAPIRLRAPERERKE